MFGFVLLAQPRSAEYSIAYHWYFAQSKFWDLALKEAFSKTLSKRQKDSNRRQFQCNRHRARQFLQ